MREQREEEYDDGDAEGHGDPEPPPEHVVGVSRGHSDDDRKEQQGQGVGDDGASHGDGDGLVAGDSEFADDGVCDERLRGEEPCEEDRGVDRESEDVIPGEDSEHEGHAEGVESENEASPAVVPEVGHVHFESREEHDIEESGGSGEDDAAVAQDEVEPVGADDRPGDDEPQQVGDLEPVEQQGRREDDDQNQQELQDRILEGQRQVYVRSEKHRERESVIQKYEIPA